ncbi:peptidase C15 [Xanthobacter sp. AM11]|uniref:pyroglutamyl-peptidase I family protein n=1 Tax=Xanthobacter sp. AM11 TaxID=3380643 RepID=UPI0039BEE5A9
MVACPTAAGPPPRNGPRLLVCAFGPFPGVPVNPSRQAALDLLRRRRPALAGADIRLEILPTRWDALERLDAVLERLKPDAVLLLGVAARRREVCVETVAVNAARAFPDAARRHAPARLLARGGPHRRATTAAAGQLVQALRNAGIACRPSRDAGRYLCNASYFHALAWAARQAWAPPVVFVHLPRRSGRPRGVGRVGMALGLSALLARLAARARAPRRRPATPASSPTA